MTDSDKPVDPAQPPEAEAPTTEVSEAEQEEDAKPLEPACLDLTDYKPKVDHFENIHVLTKEENIEGAPNFRQVSYTLH